MRVARTLGAAEGAACFVALAPVGDASLVATTIASALGVQEVPGRPLIETLYAYLENKPGLLILDNCEHLIMETALIVEALLARCSGVRVLATSREPLRVAGERRYRLPSLNAQDAMALFRDRAQEVDHCFALDDENAPIVAALCQRLDGIPLAIEFAAARVNVLTTKTLSKMLDDRFQILSGGPRTALPRQKQTMRATIDWSYELLSPQEQRLFERLSVFAGGCTLAIATTVCSGDCVAENEIPELLLSLVNKSTVTVDVTTREPRYGLLESFRQYAREKVATRSEQHALAHRHARACLNLAEELRVAWDVQPDAEWMESARAEMENWRQALEFALAERCDVALGQSLVAALVHAWVALGPAEGRRWSTLARDLVCEGTPPEVVAGLDCVDAFIANLFEEVERELAASSDAL